MHGYKSFTLALCEVFTKIGFAVITIPFVQALISPLHWKTSFTDEPGFLHFSFWKANIGDIIDNIWIDWYDMEYR